MRLLESFLDGLELLLTKYDNLIGTLFNIMAIFVTGLITYSVTSKINKHEFKKSELIIRRDSAVIPLGVAVEKALVCINAEYFPLSISNDSDFPKLLLTILSYVSVEKRIMISTELKQKINCLSVAKNEYFVSIKDTIDKIQSTTSKDIEPLILQYYGDEWNMGFSCSFCKNFLKDVEIAVLQGSDFNILHYLSSFQIITNDDPDNFKHIDYNLGENFFDNIIAPLNSGCVSEDDLEITEKQHEYIKLYEFLEQNISFTNQKILSVIHNAGVWKNYEEMTNKLNEIREQCIKEIDYATKF